MRVRMVAVELHHTMIVIIFQILTRNFQQILGMCVLDLGLGLGGISRVVDSRNFFGL